MSLNGFLIDLHAGTEGRLEVEVDCSHLDWDQYRRLIIELEDLLSSIDAEHSARSELVRGRSLRARYRRVSAESRTRRLRFSPFPSRMSNVLKNTRAYMYELVAENCLTLQHVGNRKLQLLPKALAPYFVEAVERVNEEVIRPLNAEIERFREGDDYLRIQQLLYKYGVDPSALRTSAFLVGEYVVDVLPVDFGYSVDLDEAYAKERRAEAAKGMEILRRRIEERRREYAMRAVSDLVRRIAELAGAVDAGVRVRQLDRKVEALMGAAEALGLGEVREKVLEPLRAVCGARSRGERARLAKELFGEEGLKRGVERALEAISPGFLEDRCFSN
jgi:hypothetical protein